MENNFWSTKLQSSEVLFKSRAQRFNSVTKKYWIDVLGVKNGMRVLEVGCGGGNFIQMIKRYLPDCKCFGMDLDSGHIKYAKKISKEIDLDINYVQADLRKLPYKDETFDIVFSFTVVPFLPFPEFVSEQKRVLKKGGKIVVIDNSFKLGLKNEFDFKTNEYKQLHSLLEFKPVEKFETFDTDMQSVCKNLSECGFKVFNANCSQQAFYFPDITNKKNALNQVKMKREAEIAEECFALDYKLAKPISNQVRERILALLNEKFNEREILLKENKKVFDFVSPLVFYVSATKL